MLFYLVLFFSHIEWPQPMHIKILVWCEIICSMLWRFLARIRSSLSIVIWKRIGREPSQVFSSVRSCVLFYIQNDKFSAFMVFGLIGGLRHLMWFVHASEPANLKILFQSEMQALHGSLNFCARDCGNRCKCERVYGSMHVWNRNRSKHTIALIPAMILNTPQTAPIYNNSFEVRSIVVPHTHSIHRIFLGIFIIFELPNLKKTENSNKQCV